MTLRLKADAGGIAQAAHLLQTGELVAFGTETVYGLGGDATNAHAVAKIFDAKGRPRFNPLICHFADPAAAFEHVAPNLAARTLAETFWPGPLTLILSRLAGPIALLAGAGHDTLAVRVPAHEVAQALLRAVARPIAAPSANRSGGVSPVTADHVSADLQGRIAGILDSGPCPVGLESTVLDLSGPRPVLLRPGGIPMEAIEALIGPVARGMPAGEGVLRSPGMLASHYAPSLPVRLQAAATEHTEALLAFGPPLHGAGLVWSLSEVGDLTEAASRLFAGLRFLDAQGTRLGLSRIAAMPVPDTGLGEAINDRPRRAAAPRG